MLQGMKAATQAKEKIFFFLFAHRTWLWRKKDNRLRSIDAMLVFQGVGKTLLAQFKYES